MLRPAPQGAYVIFPLPACRPQLRQRRAVVIYILPHIAPTGRRALSARHLGLLSTTPFSFLSLPLRI